ncbi:MAG: SusC/RagA family TonB-linked outer membrane protein [Gemmatimonadota bacterium]
MNNNRPTQRALGVLALALSPIVAIAQRPAEGIVTGRVIDGRTSQPIAAVTVTVQGTQHAVVSGNDGAFRIVRVPLGERTLTARRVGFAPVTRRITVPDSGTVTADFTLQPTVTNLQAVLVTGTAGDQLRETQPAVVSGIDASDLLSKTSVVNVTQVLAGRVPSLQIVTGSGVTGSSARINIRGAVSYSLTNDPIVFIDGIRMRSAQRDVLAVTGGQAVNALNDINPDDIESIEVVKGPAAATLYGADASAGVIQIITKKGKVGLKRLSHSISTEYNRIEPNFTPFTNYAKCTAASILPTSASAFCSGKTVGTIVSDNPNVRGGTYDDGDLQSLRYSAQGGGDNYGFYVSGAADNEQGTTINNTLVRRDGRASLTWVATPDLGLDFSLGLAKNDYNLPQGDQSSYGSLIFAALGSVIGVTRDANGNLSSGFAANLSVDGISSIIARSNTMRATPRIQANYTPIGWFSNRVTFGADLNNTAGTTFFPVNAFNWYSGDQSQGWVNSVRENANIYTVDYLGSIRTTVLRSDVSSELAFGSQFIRTTLGQVQATGKGLLTNSSNLASSASTVTGAEFYNDQKSLGFFAQEQLGFRDKLFVQVGARVDRNSAFGKGSQASTIFLPKVGASYLLSREAFWNRYSSVLSTVRLRAAYGSTGRSPTPGSSLRTYGKAPYISDLGIINNGVVPRNPGNDSLKPERGTEFEGGIDVGLFDDRAGIEVTYYKKNTSDLLVINPLPPSLGFTGNPLVNIGKVENHGLEFVVRARPFDSRNFSWDASVIGSTLSNEVLSLGGNAPVVTTSIGVSNKVVPGRSLGAWFTRKIRSYDSVTNVVMVGDTTEFVGNVLPSLSGSFNSTFTLFRNVTVYALFQGQRGAKSFNLGQQYRDAFLGNSGEVILPAGQGGYSARDRARRLGPFRTPSGATLGGTQGGDDYLQSTDYLRFQELSVTLKVPDRFAQAVRASSAAVTLGGRNLRLWTKFGGPDPDVSTLNTSQGGIAQFLQAELFTQPPVRRWIARVNLQF